MTVCKLSRFTRSQGMGVTEQKKKNVKPGAKKGEREKITIKGATVLDKTFR